MKKNNKKINQSGRMPLKQPGEYQLSDLCKKYGITEEKFKKQFEESRAEFSLRSENRFRINAGGILPFPR